MGKAAKRRERAKRVDQRYKTTGFSPPDRSAKRYFTYFFIRDSHVRNNRERGSFLDRLDTIQIPDVLRMVSEHRAGTSISNRHAARKRTIYKKEALRRGCETKIYNMVLFIRTEMVEMLAGASLEDEGFVEQVHLLEAAKIEMRYALSQGIIGEHPTLENTYLTLKCWFLFSGSPEFAGCTSDRKEFWGSIVDIAVKGHAAVSVVDVLKDPESQAKAWKWAKGILGEFVDGEVPMAESFFLNPMFGGGGDEDPGSDEGTSDSDEGVSDQLAGSTGDAGEEPAAGRPIVYSHDSVAVKVACVVAKLNAIVTLGGDEPHKQVNPMMQDIRYCLRSWDHGKGVEFEPVPTDGFEYEAEIVWKALEVLAFREKMCAYRSKVKKDLQAPQDPDEGDGSWREETNDDDEPDLPTVPEPPGADESAPVPTNDEDHPRHSSKDYIRELVNQFEKTKAGELPRELKDLQTFGFFTVQVFPFWYIAMVERLAKSVKGRNFVTLFKRQSTVKYDRWDDKRLMNTIVQDDFLHRLINSPLKAMMRGLGLLGVVGSEEKREVDVCGSLLSKPRRKLEKTLGLQGMHADMDAWFKWKRMFGFSVITAGKRVAHLDIYAGSWDGGRGVAREPVRVDLPPGCSIVFHGLARHRGVSYPYESLRLFVSFVVKSVFAQSNESDVTRTTALEKHKFQEPLALPLDEWKKKYMIRLT